MLMRPGSIEKRQRLDIFYAMIPLAVGLFLWVISLKDLNPARMGDLGLVSIFPPIYYISLFLLSCGFVVFVYREKRNELLLSLYVVALIFILHGTPQILYGTLRYSWAWKHVGIIDYIQRNAGVDPTIPVLDVYHNWPGFFAIGTLFTQATGVPSSLIFAGWAPVFFNLLSFGALLLLFKAFTLDRRLLWSGIWLFFISNWVGQDYFSPQAFSYFFYLIVIGICLNWFKEKQIPSVNKIKRWLFSDRITEFFHSILDRAHSKDGQVYPTRSLQRVGLMLIVILLLAVITASHQLTPLMMISALVALVISQYLQARSLPILMSVFTVAWIFFVATPFLELEILDLIKYIGQIFGNVNESLVDLSSAAQDQQIVSFFSRLLTLLVWGLAVVGFIRRWRTGRMDLAALLLAVAPFIILISSSYGGEVLFRIYLFSLPPIVFFAASAVHPEPRLVNSWRVPVIMILLNAILLSMFSVAYFGKDRSYYFTEKEVEASQYLYSTAPPGSLLIEGSRNYPSQFINYEYFTNVYIDREPVESRLKIIDQPVEVLSRWLDNDQYTATYLIITRSQKIASEASGAMPPGALDDIEQALNESELFEVLFSNPDVKIFILSRDNP